MASLSHHDFIDSLYKVFSFESFKVLLLIFIVPYKFLIKVYFNQTEFHYMHLFIKQKSIESQIKHTALILNELSLTQESDKQKKKKNHEELNQRCQPHHHKEAQYPQSFNLQDQSTVLRT